MVEPANKKTKRATERDDTDDDDTTNTDITATATLLLGEAPPSPAASSNRRRSTKSLSPSKSSSSAASSPQTTKTMTQSRQSSERRTGGGGMMNPRRIMAGRGLQNEVIRRTVYDGALRVEDEPYKIVKEAMADYCLGRGGESEIKPPTLNARPEWRKLLPLTGFIRPSVDTSLKSMTVTELMLSDESPSDEMADDMAIASVPSTVATYQSVPILISPEQQEDIGGEEALSMRGGGLENEADAAPPSQQQENVAVGSDSNNVPANVEASGEVEVIQQPSEAAPPTDESGNVPNADNVATSVANIVDAEIVVEGDITTDTSIKPVENVQEEVKEDAMQIDVSPPQPAETSNEEPKETAPMPEAAVNEEELKVLANEGETKPMEVDPPHAGEGNNESAVNEAPASSDNNMLTEATPAVLPNEGTPHEQSATENVADAIQPPTSEIPEVAASPQDDAATKVNQSVTSGEDVTIEHTSEVPTVPVASGETQADPTTVSQQPVYVAAATDSQTQVLSSNAPTEVATAVAQVKVESSSNTQVPVSASQAAPSSAAATTAVPTASTNTQSAIPQVFSLPAGTQLSTSLNQASSNNNAEENEPTIPKPSWYDPSKPSELEQRTLPEWFNASAPHRTAATYIAVREKILDLAKRNGQQFITSTALRRSVAGDAGSLLRLHQFLMDWGLLNSGQVGETAPSDSVLRGVHAAGGALAGTKRKSPEHVPAVSWTSERVHALEASVCNHISKQTSLNSPAMKIVVNWEDVASELGGGVTPSDCQRAFVNPPSEAAKMIADASASGSKALFSNILDGVRPEVLNAAIEASLQSTNDIVEARKASFAAAVASAAAEKGAKAESDIERTLMDIVDQRLQRLENRVALLDDVEALMEAERVSLELERRDMYTTRCRHWFG